MHARTYSKLVFSSKLDSASRKTARTIGEARVVMAAVNIIPNEPVYKIEQALLAAKRARTESISKNIHPWTTASAP